MGGVTQSQEKSRALFFLDITDIFLNLSGNHQCHNTLIAAVQWR